MKQMETVKSDVGMCYKSTSLISVAEIIHETVKSFKGEKNYMATGDLSNENTKELDFITHANRPSRADLTAKKGDVVLARMKATNKVLLVQDIEADYIYSTGFIVLRPSKVIDNNYLLHFLQSSTFQDEKDKLCTGATQKAINNQNFAQLQIPLPPLPIQKRIAEILDAADALKRKDQELLKKYDELAQAIFIDMFGDPVKNEKGWEMKKLGLVTNMKAGDFISASEILNDLEENLYPCYGGNGLRGFVKSFTHNGNYILIGRQGALCGNVKITTGRFHATEHAIVCSPKIEYNVLWFYYLLGDLNLNKYASGAAQPGLNVSTLVDIKVIFAPLKLQNQFAEKLELIEEQKTNLKANLIYTKQLFNSLIQKAFKGELVSE